MHRIGHVIKLLKPATRTCQNSVTTWTTASTSKSTKINSEDSYIIIHRYEFLQPFLNVLPSSERLLRISIFFLDVKA